MVALKNQFNCYGYFYNLYQNKKLISECRSVLEIVKKDFNLHRKELLEHKPNAIFIMMNSGTSFPINQTPIIIDREDFELDYNDLVLTNPDDTQSRVMSVMKEMNWNHVRVLNLSDIREKESEELSSVISSFEDTMFSNRHSIFSVEREVERRKLLSNQGIPIILAWGTIKSLKVLGGNCLSFLETEEIDYIGVPSIQDEIYFHHPLTTKLSWKTEIIKLIQN